MPFPRFLPAVLPSTACLLLAACAASSAVDKPAPGRAVVRGRALFEARCSTCHGLPDAQACAKAVMDSMAPAAQLKPDERAAVEAYLAAARK